MSEGLKKCGNCKELITEDYIHCDGISFHREHFTCNFCDLELGGKHYYKKENKYYCENDYFNVYGHICNYCAYPIKYIYIYIYTYICKIERKESRYYL